MIGTLILGSSASSILSDFLARAIGSHLWPSVIEKMPSLPKTAVDLVVTNYLGLCALTSSYAHIWESITDSVWNEYVPLRIDEERRAAQNDIDAIVAISLGVTADELCMIYRTQFPVMRRYDQEDRYDANGRKVPKEILKKQAKVGNDMELSEGERRWTHPQSGVEYLYEYPFRQLDREADLRAAYAKYEKILKED